MSDSGKTARVSDQKLPSEAYEPRELGQERGGNGNPLQRLQRWIKLDNSDAKPEHGRWNLEPVLPELQTWRSHHCGGLHSTLMEQKTSLAGSAYTWAFLSGLNSMLGNYGTMAVNINDFARYAKSTKMIFGQIIVIPLSFMLLSFIGIIIAGAASDKYGEAIWDPLTIMAHWNGGSGARAAAAFVSLSFVLAQLGANISANCVSAANDLNAMFPSYVNLRRGSFIIAFVGAWALTPWNILSSASALLNFMDGYIIWLAPITGVLLADYYVVHRQSYDVEEMYIPGGKYQYNRFGTNWRALVAWLAGCLPLIGGFAAAMDSSLSVSAGAIHLYKLGYLYGFFSSFVLYSALSIGFPPRSTFSHSSDPGET
ncbi:hypothetical protein FKW77_004642 [Venturia effusa]|uniref:Uncharacterized protein n=1 Tax=Venturia effusa TaxID=50376 RepID=A0A517KZD7_9PEZI|nr:hypothetical protein FKW77_004642 [Venturia effusa]